MAYDLTNFSDYIARENAVLTKTLFAGGDTGKFALFMGGVKGSTTVPHLSGEATLQSGSCATPQGDTQINEVTLTVKPFTVFESFCEDDLQNKLPNTVLAPGSNNGDKLTWEEQIVANKIASIQEKLELTYWQGDTNGTHNLFDGYIKKADADSNVIEGNTSSATSITKNNVKELIEDMRIASPAKVKRSKEYVTLVGDDVFDMYISKEKADNLYHYKPEHDEGIYNIGGGQGALIRVYGLDGTGRMFSSVGANFIVGSDAQGEADVADVFYDKVSDKMHIRVKGKAGVVISNADEIVEFTLSV
ncbi:hypothetical protein BA195_10135 [Tenacibaculum soleae]|uniref:Uncharacterized protein n=1 Tax=Tenacibaculum soleae TaxID=447689 RepID=A0A1B9XY94_9FLAO|nr:hypothetical protein [Tenacibaculum soleae]OCK42525.1 hypothetical protein BA195_10135 [Tenacibaculum soleae]